MRRDGLVGVPEDVAEALALAAPRLGPLAGRVSWYAEVASTNDEALGLAGRGAPEGWLVGADSQSAGRGRHGRVWLSPPWAGLYLSIVLRPPAHAVRLLTLAAGVAVADGIHAATGAAPGVKWPNDIYFPGPGTPGAAGRPDNPRKVAGVLAEANAAGAQVEFVVIGIGINVALAALPPAVASRATSIEAELGRTVSRGAVAAEVCVALWRRYQQLLAGETAGLLQAWRARGVATFGRPVEWDVSGGTLSGVARDVDASGALIVDTTAGVARVESGEVRWLA